MASGRHTERPSSRVELQAAWVTRAEHIVSLTSRAYSATVAGFSPSNGVK